MTNCHEEEVVHYITVICEMFSQLGDILLLD